MLLISSVLYLNVINYGGGGQGGGGAVVASRPVKATHPGMEKFPGMSQCTHHDAIPPPQLDKDEPKMC